MLKVFCAVVLSGLLASCSLFQNDVPNTSNVRFSRSAAESDGTVVKDADVFEFPANMANETLKVSLVREYQNSEGGEEVLRREELTIERSSDPGRVGAGELALAKADGSRDVTVEAIKGAITAGLLAAGVPTGSAGSIGSAIDNYLSKPKPVATPVPTPFPAPFPETLVAPASHPYEDH